MSYLYALWLFIHPFYNLKFNFYNISITSAVLHNKTAVYRMLQIDTS